MIQQLGKKMKGIPYQFKLSIMIKLETIFYFNTRNFGLAMYICNSASKKPFVL